MADEKRNTDILPSQEGQEDARRDMGKIYVLSMMQEESWVKSGTASEGGEKCRWNGKLSSNPGNLREQNRFVPGNTAKTALKVRKQWCKIQKKRENIKRDKEKH